MHSYQSARSGWKTFVLLAAVFAAGARPYEDTQKRFVLKVPTGWTLAPQFGDTTGMVFERSVPTREGGGSALFIVRADPRGAQALPDYITQIEATFQAIPGYRSGTSSDVQLDGRSATRRTYQTKGRKLTSTFLEANGFFYLLHFEAPRAASTRLWPQAKQMLESFRPGSVKAASPIASPARPVASAPIGRWKSASGLVLRLEEDGSYELADVQGNYRVDGQRLVLSRPDGGRTSFGFEHEDGSDRLVLTSPDLAQPIVYKRAAAARPPNEKHLIGKWRAVGVEPPFELRLDQNGEFGLGPYSGKWAVKSGSLRLAKTPTEFITYAFRFAKKNLVLSGGDLDAPVHFKRVR